MGATHLGDEPNLAMDGSQNTNSTAGSPAAARFVRPVYGKLKNLGLSCWLTDEAESLSCLLTHEAEILALTIYWLNESSSCRTVIDTVFFSKSKHSAPLRYEAKNR